MSKLDRDNAAAMAYAERRFAEYDESDDERELGDEPDYESMAREQEDAQWEIRRQYEDWRY